MYWSARFQSHKHIIIFNVAGANINRRSSSILTDKLNVLFEVTVDTTVNKKLVPSIDPIDFCHGRRFFEHSTIDWIGQSTVISILISF